MCKDLLKNHQIITRLNMDFTSFKSLLFDTINSDWDRETRKQNIIFHFMVF
jgi:hypothetical protein